MSERTSRERYTDTLNHIEPDKVVVDLGATRASGIAASTLDKLRKYNGITDRKVKVSESLQILGEVEEIDRKLLGVDIVAVEPSKSFFGFKDEGGWHDWTLFDGTEVLIPEEFRTTVDNGGRTYIYPQGDLKAQPSGLMPKDGYYFDCITRQSEIDPKHMNAREDYKEDFEVFTEETLRDLEGQADYYHNYTDYGITGGSFLCGLGDPAGLPGPAIKYDPKGIRAFDDFLMAYYIYPEYVKEMFALQTEVMLKNLKLYKEAVGDKIQTIQISGTDFGTQNGCMLSVDMFREFHKPFYTQINEWIHKNTSWKTFYHSCGAIYDFLDDFVEMGVDVLNPVQCSAVGMDAGKIKENYGDKLVFWGGGVDTQVTLPFGTPEEVYEQTLERCRIFAPGGGFIFNPIHNIQAKTPPENIMAMFEAVKTYNKSKMLSHS